MAVADTPGTRAWKSASMRGQSTTVRARPGRRTGACFTSASRSCLACLGSTASSTHSALAAFAACARWCACQRARSG